MLILILYALLALSTIWVLIDSRRNQVPTGKGPYAGSNTLVWLGMCIALWIVAFPIYLFRRAKTLKERNPSSSGTAAFVLGGLCVAIVLFCTVGTLIWGSGIKITSDRRMTDSELTQHVKKLIEDKWQENAASKDLRMKDITLAHQTGDEYEGSLVAESSGQEGKYHEAPRSPEDQLRERVGKNIENMWKASPDTKNFRLKDITLSHESGNEYTGTAIADAAGAEKKFPFHVTYDSAHDNLSLQMGDPKDAKDDTHDKRMSDEELRDEVSAMIEKKYRENPKSQDVHLESMTLSRQSEEEFIGIATLDVSGHEEQHSVRVHYDDKGFNYEVK
jgi:hypothetical protein